jgi:hypothetical protein
VTVRRGDRLISREEIFHAVQSALASNPVPGITSLQPQDIAVEAAVRVPPGDPGLEVTQIAYDPLIGRARIRLWPRSAPGVLPFYVTVKAAAAESMSAPKRSHHVVSTASDESLASVVSGPVLVVTGCLARLHLHSSNMDMLLDVRPLQKGHLGEVIRVSYLDATL